MAASVASGRRVGDGLAVGPDLVGAAEVATGQALAALDGAPPDLLVFFVCPGGVPALPPARVEAAGLRVMELARARTAIGATAHGVLAEGCGVEGSPAVAVWAAALPGARVAPFAPVAERRPGPVPGGGDEVTVRGVRPPTGDDQVELLLVDPAAFPVAGLLERVNRTHPGLAIVGGLASAPGGEGANRLFVDGRVHGGGAVGAVLGGDAGLTPVVSQGCRPIGPSMVVTRVERNRIMELAGRPAAERLREIVTELPADDQDRVLHALHLGVAVDEYADTHERGDFLIRSVLDVESGPGTVVAGQELDVGTTVRFQVRDAAGAGRDLHELLGPLRRAGPPAGALLFSGAGRGAGMFGDAGHDVRTVRAGLGSGAAAGRGGGPPVAGCFAAGEIGPVGGRNHVHGVTASMVVVER